MILRRKLRHGGLDGDAILLAHTLWDRLCGRRADISPSCMKRDFVREENPPNRPRCSRVDEEAREKAGNMAGLGFSINLYLLGEEPAGLQSRQTWR